MNAETTQDYYDNNASARWFALASISISIFCVSMTMSAVNIAVPAIALDFSANAILVGWVPTAFLLANAIFLIPAGRAADLYGRKKVFITGMSVFCLACLMATLAPNIELLLVTRLLQGIGGALAFATGLAIVMSIFTAKNRGTAIGINSATLYFGLSCGPIIGGWFTDNYGWRVVFLFPLVLGTIAIIMIIFRLKGEWRNEQAGGVDWYGGLVFAIASSTLFIGISMIPGMNAAGLLFAGTILFGYFVYQQIYSDKPLIHFKAIIENRVFSRSLMGNVCIYWSNYPFIFLLSLYLQFIRGMSPADAGQIMVLQPLTMAIVAPFAGRLSDQFEPRVIATAGCLVMACAFGLLQGLDTQTPVALICVAMLIQGLGFGLFTTPNNNAALSSLDKSRFGIGSALLNFARVSGNMIGTAMVLLLVSIFIGKVEIRPDQYPGLLRVVGIALAMSFMLVITGSYFSHSRGNIRQI
jgi:EmrB/QacA subfamily drug resistance transporter